MLNFMDMLNSMQYGAWTKIAPATVLFRKETEIINIIGPRFVSPTACRILNQLVIAKVRFY